MALSTRLSQAKWSGTHLFEQTGDLGWRIESDGTPGELPGQGRSSKRARRNDTLNCRREKIDPRILAAKGQIDFPRGGSYRRILESQKRDQVAGESAGLVCVRSFRNRMQATPPALSCSR